VEADRNRLEGVRLVPILTRAGAGCFNVALPFPAKTPMIFRLLAVFAASTLTLGLAILTVVAIYGLPIVLPPGRRASFLLEPLTLDGTTLHLSPHRRRVVPLFGCRSSNGSSIVDQKDFRSLVSAARVQPARRFLHLRTACIDRVRVERFAFPHGGDGSACLGQAWFADRV